MPRHARSRRLCCLFKHLEHVAGSDGSLIVPGLGHGTRQANNMPRASSQHPGWARMTQQHHPQGCHPQPARMGPGSPGLCSRPRGEQELVLCWGNHPASLPRVHACAAGGSQLSEGSLAAGAGCKPVAGGLFPASPEQLAARLQQSVAVRARGTLLPPTKGFLHGSCSSFTSAVAQGLQRPGRVQRVKVGCFPERALRIHPMQGQLQGVCKMG